MDVVEISRVNAVAGLAAETLDGAGTFVAALPDPSVYSATAARRAGRRPTCRA